jgi:hypothetical protein
MSSRQPPSRATAASGVRRNLFSHINRRAATGPSSNAGSSATTLQLENQDAGSDIVVRDEHGNYHLDQPSVGHIPDDNMQERTGMHL